MSYQLLAIKVLTGCSSNIRKCLNEDTLYFLSSSYKKDPNCNENLLKEEVSIENKSAYKDLYKVKKANGEYLRVKVSAIVGMNGDGKSSFVELIIRILNNFAYAFGFLSDQETLCYISGLNANLYYEVNGNIFCISCNNDVTKWYRNGKELYDINFLIVEEEKKKELKKHVDSLFYTMIINYSLYAYNSEILKGECSNSKSWIDGLFHKNDGYQTPVVITPMRISGNIDVNKEEYLSRQRLLSIFMTAKAGDGGRNISDDERAEGFAFSINKESKLISKIIDDYFFDVRPIECLWGDMKPYSNPNEKIPEGLMEIFSNFWSGFLNDYRNNKTLFNIAFAANKTWEKNSRTDLSRYFNLFKQNALKYYRDKKQFSFRAITMFSNLKRDFKINYMQFYRVLIIIAIWRQLTSRNDLPLENEKLDEALNKQHEPRFACMLYVLYKVISIMDTYKGLCNPWYLYDQSYMVFERQWPNENIEGAIATDINKILSVHDYRTLKLWQTLNYLKRDADDLYGAKECEIPGVKEKYNYFISFDDLNNNFSSVPENKLLSFLPAPVFVGDIVLNRYNDFYTVNTLSSGMIPILNSVGSFIYHIRNLDNEQKDDLLIDYSNITVIFEEVELYFHPEYQKSYLYFLLKQIERSQITKLNNLHIIFVTHSPFVLSDVLSNNILCLKDGKQIASLEFYSFGANIHDLLRQPFFMKNGTIGDYAQSIINKIITILRLYTIFNCENNINISAQKDTLLASLDDISGNMTEEQFKKQYSPEYLFDLISMLDEPLVKHSLMKEYDRIFSTNYYNSQMIQHLEEELKRLKKQK